MSKVILAGEPMAMFVADRPGPLDGVENFSRSLAGAEVNVAVGLTRLGHRVSYLTRLGDDPFGTYIGAKLRSENIDAQIRVDTEHPTGFQLKGRAVAGDPEVVYFRRGSAASHLSEDDVEQADFSGACHVHLTGILPALSLSCRNATYRLIERARECGLGVSLDPNLRPSLWENRRVMVRVLNDLASRCDIFLPGQGEAEILAGVREPEAVASFYLGLGAKTVVVKMGPDGAYAATARGGFRHGGFRVESVVDTVGAGDGFAVGIVSGVLENLGLEAMVERANAIGALQLTAAGDNEGLPGRTELGLFLEGSRYATASGN